MTHQIHIALATARSEELRSTPARAWTLPAFFAGRRQGRA